MDTCAAFKQSVNMTPAQIRAWARDPRALEFSWAPTRRRLPALADLKAKPCRAWTDADVRRARRVLSFNARTGAWVRLHGCSRGKVISLRNWGRQPPGCPVPRRTR